ncbi:MAG: transcription elongation factor GreA [Eubacteriales bacterium]|nr:transcription elongation factor GreA [Eubacteriales bacterium]
MAKQITLTYEGLEKLEKELEHLKTVGRNEVAEKIKEARGFGDLSENSEYDEAKNEQAQMEVRIAQIEAMLKNVKLIDEEEIDTEKVSVGCKIKVKDITYKETVEYSIVGSTEANPFKGKLSDESPVGASFIGKKVGDKVSVETPSGVCEYKILSIEK